jgi:hypothetical protein
MSVTLDNLRDHILKPQPGFLYEPRAFWDFIPMPYGFDSGDTFPLIQGEVSLNSDHFYNGSKYPIILTKLCILPRLGNGSGSDPSGYIDGKLIRIVSSGNQPLSRNALPLALVVGRSFEPWDRGPVASDPYANPTEGPIWNTVQWKFDHPIILPKDGGVEYSLGAMATDVPFDNDNNISETPAYLTFAERGDGAASFFKGNSRVHGTPNLQSVAGRPNSPYPPVGGAEGDPTAGNTNAVYPPAGTIQATQYRRQNVTADGSTVLDSVSITFNQRNWTSNPAYDDSNPLGSIAGSTPVKARLRGNGTGEYWWRPDAPAALVSPTRTTALTGDLPMPILLQPGDGLDITFLGADHQWRVPPIGISFCGFAAVEG